MISMDSLMHRLFVRGAAARPFTQSECIDALRRHIGELEFKRTNPGGRARHR
jgi:hypothetical protein